MNGLLFLHYLNIFRGRNALRQASTGKPDLPAYCHTVYIVTVENAEIIRDEGTQLFDACKHGLWDAKMR